MGLLDEAIREHLDLKRRRGADPTEVERAEREALGPVRREPFDSADAELEAMAAGGAYEQEGELYDDQPHGEAPFSDERDWGDAFDEEPEVSQAKAPPNGRELDDATRVMGSTPFEDDSLMEDPGSDGVLEPQAGPEKQHGEEVPEDPPDFLHDAPEHDRPRSEQRPPRDLDFDD